MGEKNLLIIGSGGYISCVVLPVLKKKFPDFKITIFSRTPGNLLTLSSRENIDYLKSWDQVSKFDHIFLACPPEDYFGYLRQIDNPAANVWIEKPIVDLDRQQFKDLYEWRLQHKGKIWAGFNKRSALKTISLKPNHNQIEINFHVDVSGGWRDQLSKGGSLWMDGIHALDLAQQLLPESNITCTSREKKLWRFTFTSEKGTAIINIGNTNSNRITVNNQVNSDFTSSKKSLEYFEWNFSEFLNSPHKSNFSFENLQSLMNSLAI